MSGNASRVRGRKRELMVMTELLRAGWVTYRLAHGPADVLALKADKGARLIQVKSTRDKWEHFRPHERALLLDEAERAGAEAFLAWWPKHGQLEWVHSSQWPALHIAREIGDPTAVEPGTLA